LDYRRSQGQYFRGRDFVVEEDILAILKFTAPVVGLVSALWSLTQKITYEAEGGVKRLTLQGRVMIGILITSAFISVLALGLEMMVKADKEEKAANAKQEEAKERREKDAMAAEEKRQDRRDAAVRHQEALLKQIQADAKEQDRFLGQRFVILDLAAKQQRRDADMSMQIAREANQRLSEAERTLAELERVNNPLRSIDAQVTLELNMEGLDLNTFWEEMAEVRNKTPYRTPDRDYVPLRGSGLPDAQIRERANRMSMRILLVPADAALAPPPGTANDEIRPLGSERNGGDFELRDLTGLEYLHPVSINAHVPSRTIIARFVTSKTWEPAGIVKGGLKLAISETTKLMPILTVQQGWLDELRGRRVTNKIVEGSICMNGLERFRGESNLRFDSGASFTLFMQSRRASTSACLIQGN
jgi:hypothetical protein